MELPKLKVLYWFHHSDCGFCRQAEPVLDAWKEKHAAEVMVVKLNMAYREWEKYGYSPRKTPAYLFAVNGQPVAKIEGALLKEKLLDQLTTGV